MVKVTAPMFSLDASGTLAKAVTFSKWKGRNYARTRVIPSNPQSGLQVGMRSGISCAAKLWAALSAAKKAAWAGGVGTEAISGFNLFTRTGQKNVRNDFSYSEQYGADAKVNAPPAPGDAAAVQNGTDVEVTWTSAAGAFTLLVFHSLTTGFAPGIVNLIGIVPSTDNTFTHRNPGIDTHYYEVRSAGADGGVGALEGEFSAVVA